MKLLLSGDLHLGRTSTRLPSGKREIGRTISAWDRVVQAAVQEKVNAVILSGDLLDKTNSYWEASGPFQNGIETLTAQGIRTLAVAGNHDADVLPALANTLPAEGFTLIGADGTWERVTLEENGIPALHIDGWSFPSPSFHQDPTRSYPATPSDTLPVLGVVHGDLGAVESPYAPLSLSRLQDLSVDGWLLGHIHKPSCTPGSPWVLMPGSPHPLDPGEPGPHHAWIVQTEKGRLSEPVPCCPAKVLYRTVDIPLQPDDEIGVDNIETRLKESVRDVETGAFQILRVVFTGHHHATDELNQLIHALPDWEHPEACVERVTVDVLPPLDLDMLKKSGPIPEHLVQALGEIPPELRTRLEQTLRTLTHQKEFSSHGLRELHSQDLPVRSLLERTLRSSLEVTE